MFVDMVLGNRIAIGQDPVLRPVFLKAHGVAHGTFSILPGLPNELRVGLFGYKSFPAWVRFSSDTLPSLPDLRSTLGIGVKLFGVPGTKLLEPEANATTHRGAAPKGPTTPPTCMPTSTRACSTKVQASISSSSSEPTRGPCPSTRPRFGGPRARAHRSTWPRSPCRARMSTLEAKRP